jgi:hypothetical protein
LSMPAVVALSEAEQQARDAERLAKKAALQKKVGCGWSDWVGGVICRYLDVLASKYSTHITTNLTSPPPSSHHSLVPYPMLPIPSVY